MAKSKVEGTPTVGSISKKWGLYRGDSLVPNHQLPVPGGKLWIGTTETFFVYQSIIFELVVSLQPWCDPLFETRGATHCFLQHMLVRPIVFYNTSNSIKTRLIKWKQWPRIQSWISKLCCLISREILNGSGLTLTFENGDKNKLTNKTKHVKRKLLWTTSTLSALLKMATFPKHFYIWIRIYQKSNYSSTDCFT